MTDQPIAKDCLALLAAIALLCGCVAPPPPKQPATPSTTPAATALTEETRQAIRVFLKCLIQHEPEMDDKMSDASTIALGLTNRCLAEYEAQTESMFSPNATQHFKQMFREQRNTREAKIEASLEVVLATRRGMVPNPNF